MKSPLAKRGALAGSISSTVSRPLKAAAFVPSAWTGQERAPRTCVRRAYGEWSSASPASGQCPRRPRLGRCGGSSCCQASTGTGGAARYVVRAKAAQKTTERWRECTVAAPVMRCGQQVPSLDARPGGFHRRAWRVACRLAARSWRGAKKNRTRAGGRWRAATRGPVLATENPGLGAATADGESAQTGHCEHSEYDRRRLRHDLQQAIFD